MIQVIPIRTNFFNFDFQTSLNLQSWWMRFEWQKRQDLYLMDFGYSSASPLLRGVPVLVNVQINKSILNHLPGSLFFYTENPRISYPNFKQLGVEVKLLYYTDDEETPIS